MRLSDAIATGRVAVIPRGGMFLFGDGSGCALGMAGVAAGLLSLNRIAGCGEIDKFFRQWPWTRDLRFVPPCRCYGYERELGACQIIGHTFDEHVITRDWTLDQLIDWVRSVEPAEPESAIAESLQSTELVEKHV